MTSFGLEIGAAGILFDSASQVRIVDSNITDVMGGMMGGIFGSSGGTLEISGSRFERATSPLSGAFIVASGGTTLTMRDSVLRDMGRVDNWAYPNILLFDGPTATISGCRFEASQIGWFYVAKVTAAPRSLWNLRMALALTLCPPPRQRLRSSSTTPALRATSLWTPALWR